MTCPCPCPPPPRPRTPALCAHQDLEIFYDFRLLQQDQSTAEDVRCEIAFKHILSRSHGAAHPPTPPWKIRLFFVALTLYCLARHEPGAGGAPTARQSIAANRQ